MLTVHHLNNSRSQRVLWLLEELGVPYELQKYQRDAKTMLAPPELTKVHPLGKSPVLTDNGITVAESGAIIEYLLETYGAGRLVPRAGSEEARRFRYWLHFAEGSAMPPLLLKLIFDRIASGQGMPFFVKPVAKGIAGKVKQLMIEPNLKRQLDFMESELAKSEWFAGEEFSAADIQMSFPVEAAAQRAGLEREPAEAHGVPEEDPRPPGIPARPRARRAVQLRQRLRRGRLSAASSRRSTRGRRSVPPGAPGVTTGHRALPSRRHCPGQASSAAAMRRPAD